MHNEGDIDLTGLTTPPGDIEELMKVNPEPWKAEVPDIENFFARFGDHLPERFHKQLRELAVRLG